MLDKRVVVGVFANRQQAEKALDKLHNAGFRDDHIGFIARSAMTFLQGNVTEKLVQTTRNVLPTGMLIGAVAGGLVVTLLTLLQPHEKNALSKIMAVRVPGGIALGMLAGTLGGRLMSMASRSRNAQEQSQYGDEEFQSSRAIVIVQADERPLDAFNILKDPDISFEPADNRREHANDPGATVKLEAS